ncbi:NAD(P)/FAD-dependent oxidoreductase [Paraconexibacter algicola]|uniref:FAD-dependent oxidoreductase n=1 Tax=Paraconexibacter algicola TaxID=2133960 RepID=A0A2T4UMF9_9ACTN|nr:FAD-dependent oxidoreductase [Paraconexibacter algicola]PTL60391.1 FAD-dependent oxidoreductase [Paraconexibacter algicola]
MADRHVDFLLIGGGVASATAAKTLREEGATGSITIVSREIDPPYHRPPATKGYLQGAESKDDALVHPTDWYAENDVELLSRVSVMGLDTDAHTATLSNKQTLSYGKALIATGAMVRRLGGVDGAQLDGIHYVRALGNSDAIRRDVEDVDRVVCIGGSYIGCEVAASLTTLGKRVAIVLQEAEPLSGGFGLRAGVFFRDVLERHGVEIFGSDEIEAFLGDGDADDARVRAVTTRNGRELAAGAVVCGVGATPDVMLARKAGLALGEAGGVLCDARLKTSADDVYAAGDMCEYDSVVHGHALRIEHEDVAMTQGATAARNMLGQDVPYDTVPYFFSDLADWTSLEYVGPARSWNEELVVGSIPDGRFTIYYVDSGVVRGALTVGGHDDLERARQLIRSGERVSAGDLGAESYPA